MKQSLQAINALLW